MALSTSLKAGKGMPNKQVTRFITDIDTDSLSIRKVTYEICPLCNQRLTLPTMILTSDETGEVVGKWHWHCYHEAFDS